MTDAEWTARMAALAEKIKAALAEHHRQTDHL